MTREIELTGGFKAIVNDADYAFLSQWSWQIDKKGYAVRTVHLGKIEGRYRKTTVKMHRVLTAAPADFQVDHMNGNKIDNRKENLRLCTNSQNQCNGASYRNSTSQYRGVSRLQGNSKWCAQIQKDKKKIMIGTFESEHEAALAYNRYAQILFGQFARLNAIEHNSSK